MISSDTPFMPSSLSLKRIADDVRAEMDAAHCSAASIEIACIAAGHAAARTVQIAESGERARIVRWLRAIAQVSAGRSRSGGEDAIFWFDRSEAFSQAADAIARHRHLRPH